MDQILTMILLQSTVWLRKTNEERLEISRMMHSTTPAVLARSGAIWLPPSRINGAWACRAALQKFLGGVEKWLEEWFVAKEQQFIWFGIQELPKRWEKWVEAGAQYFE